jgi:hypothetical protein
MINEQARCACGCPPDMHVGEIGCPCGLPDEPPCTPMESRESDR